MSHLKPKALRKKLGKPEKNSDPMDEVFNWVDSLANDVAFDVAKFTLVVAPDVLQRLEEKTNFTPVAPTNDGKLKKQIYTMHGPIDLVVTPRLEPGHWKLECNGDTKKAWDMHDDILAEMKSAIEKPLAPEFMDDLKGL